MNNIKLSESLQVSPIIHGHWRLFNWGLSQQEILTLTQKTIELGVTTFDHADIYGNYECEELFGNALNLKKELRKDIQIITKCGIKLISDKYPNRKFKTYDYSYGHIINSIENSLKNLNTDYIDLLLLHRPSPFFDPNEISRAFSQLKKSGKVLNFGVSNFNPEQFDMLNLYCEDKLVTNQIEISPLCLEHFENGNIDHFLKEKIKPMAWSPLTQGRIFSHSNNLENRVHSCMLQIADELGVNSLDKVAYSWLLSHPVSIIPIVGSGKIERIKNAVDSINIKMSNEQWLRIYNASTGVELP